MRRLALLVLAAATLTAGATTAVAVANTGVTAKKTTICHRAAKKYVAITVGNKALKPHLAHHQDVIGAPVPQNNIKAARAYCAALPVLTAKQGGQKLSAMFSNTLPGVTAKLDVRLRLGQGQLCFNLDVTGATVSSATLTSGTTAVNLTPLPIAPATSSSGCVNLTRTIAKSILQNPGSTTVSVTTSAGTLTGTLGKHA